MWSALIIFAHKATFLIATYGTSTLSLPFRMVRSSVVWIELWARTHPLNCATVAGHRSNFTSGAASKSPKDRNEVKCHWLHSPESCFWTPAILRLKKCPARAFEQKDPSLRPSQGHMHRVTRHPVCGPWTRDCSWRFSYNKYPWEHSCWSLLAVFSTKSMEILQP